ncbi:MAG: extracellular solute-binding protein [Anaerostipes sp.]|nr:extracellular solute-binding protein [Anaerostipes sp.]
MREKKEVKAIYLFTIALFLFFLFVPVVMIVYKACVGEQGFTGEFFKNILWNHNFFTAFRNSIGVSILSAVITTVLAFVLAYTINYTNVHPAFKKVISTLAVLPMLLPTITYGFAIIYSFGKQGFLTKVFHHQFFDIYGINGLLIGYVIYTLPISFLLLHNTMQYIDKKFIIVSKVMGDKPLRTFLNTILRPMWGTLIASLVQCFFLSFTDYGIPASVGGRFQVIAGTLYNEMLGSVPNFNQGAVVAIMMLLPSVISIGVLTYVERYNIRYNKISVVELRKNKARDGIMSVASVIILTCMLSIFVVLFIIPFVAEWPYEISFTTAHISEVFADTALLGVYKNSLFVAIMTAIVGTLVVYGSALVTARSEISPKWKKCLEGIALITNTIPGMVLGIAFLLTFTGTSIQNTFLVIVVCNVIHFFSTPFLMMKSSLEKMNRSWETTARLMGDSWIKTLVRIITPNAWGTILEVFNYYFVNAMVTVSAIIFITGARTMVITTKIKELQHYAKFNEIFVLSLLILLTNLVAKGGVCLLTHKNTQKRRINMRKLGKRLAVSAVALIMAVGGVMTGCSKKGNDKVVFYSNADDEAVEVMKKTLDENGYKDKYIFQSFGTSELGGKLTAEKSNIEADLITMSSYYISSAEEKNHMFLDLDFKTNSLAQYPSYYTPITAQEGALIVNTKEMKKDKLAMPKSIKDLAKPEYKGHISVTDIKGSSTAWLMIQALINEYGESEAKTILKGIYKNAGDHLEESGSGPIKKVRAGEVAIGFGLRHQAVADKKDGLPIDYIDPTEGNFTLTESVAVIDKGDKTNKLAMKMAECIIKKGRKDLIKYYPNTIYKGEKADAANQSKKSTVFKEPLTVDLLEAHQKLSESCK